MKYLIIALTLLFVTPANARHYHYRQPPQQSFFDWFSAWPAYSGSSIGKPSRFISGALVCARNVNSALAERGIKGTGSALAHSFDHWGHRVASPVPGAVAVSDRKGGGHVAIVSRVEGSRVWVWNATGGRHGWHEIEYTGKHARYRVASQF